MTLEGELANERDLNDESTPSPVRAVPAADSQDAAHHFERLLGFETDCWDVHESIESGNVDFVLLDVRSPEFYDKGHIPTATNLPHGRVIERNLSDHPMDTLFVVYCAGPHCNGADRAALRFAKLGRPVKKMIGGIEGWIDEGFELELAKSPRLDRVGF
jgi:rhodanese-related sulfurtransferase